MYLISVTSVGDNNIRNFGQFQNFQQIVVEGHCCHGDSFAHHRHLPVATLLFQSLFGNICNINK